MGIAARSLAILILALSGQSMTYAAASAEIDFNINGGQSYTTFLNASGATYAPYVPVSVRLGPGQRAVFDINYRIQTFNDGLVTTVSSQLYRETNNAFLCTTPMGNCNPVFPNIPIISATADSVMLKEFSFAALTIVKSISTGLYVRSEGDYGTLEAGSGAERSILVGTQHLIFYNNNIGSYTTETAGFSVGSQAWVIAAAAVPEPATAHSLAGGLCLLLLVWFRRTASARAPSV